MDTPQYDNNPAFELPPVKPEKAKMAGDQLPSYEVPQSSEHAPAPAERSSQPSQGVPVAQSQQTSQPQASADPQQPSQAQATTTPQVADDTDLIEKEWVEKAKEIVARTAKDPHRQNVEMSKFKADYVKKRYNKDLRLDTAA